MTELCPLPLPYIPEKGQTGRAICISDAVSKHTHRKSFPSRQPRPFPRGYPMAHFQAQSVSEQVAAHLKDEVAQGEWSGTMPGEERLMRRLGVGAATAREALKLLEKEGVLVGQGAGRRRKIVLPENHAPPALRVGLLHFDPPARSLDYMIELHHRLEDAGQTSFYTDKTLTELGMDVGRVAHYVKKIEADSWIVCAASHEVLEWFAAQETPTFALFGRMAGLSLAGA
ncbi:GntR family transcriptional regulator [bacterium]|nr:GntR family transcriptional regulator [bacterium]